VVNCMNIKYPPDAWTDYFKIAHRKGYTIWYSNFFSRDTFFPVRIARNPICFSSPHTKYDNHKIITFLLLRQQILQFITSLIQMKRN
jgi:hypothetical protein